MACGDNYGNQSPEAIANIRRKLIEAKAREAVGGNGADESTTLQRTTADTLHQPLAGRWSRLGMWFDRLVYFPHVDGQQPSTYRRTRAFLRWGIYIVFKSGPSFLAALLGGRVSDDDFKRRMVDCSECDSLLRIAAVRRGDAREDWYCGDCGCPPWVWRIPFSWKVIVGSVLTWKNRRRYWRCPIGKHRGSIPWLGLHQRDAERWERKQREFDEQQRREREDRERRVAEEVERLKAEADPPAATVPVEPESLMSGPDRVGGRVHYGDL